MSLRGTPVELIGDGRAFLAWLGDVDLLDSTTAAIMRRRFGTAGLDAVAGEARQVRSWARAWLGRWRDDPSAFGEHDLRKLNALLERADAFRQVTRHDGGLRIEERQRGNDADELLGLVAAQIADLVANEDPTLVKSCAGS